MEFERLSLANESEALALLQDVWPRLYGATGCPQFSLGYLRWLYGGPNAERHFLAGVRINGRLAAFKASLSRDLILCNKPTTGSLATHLTISPELAPEHRLAVAAEMSRLHTIDGTPTAPQSNVLLAFFESNKTLLRNISRMAERQRLSITTSPFRQAIINARRVQAAATEAASTPIRHADIDNDIASIHNLLTDQPDKDLLWTPSLSGLHHHLSQAPGAAVWIAEEAGECTGVLAGYQMDWLKNGVVTHMFIVEVLTARDPAATARLLATAVEHAARMKYRGVVLENPTMLAGATASKLGVIETAREMAFVARSHHPLPGGITEFSLDIK
ncbi:MAG: hypothetical protein ACK5II_06925 [Paracoccus sp. (in: a-proteobacteria)]